MYERFKKDIMEMIHNSYGKSRIYHSIVEMYQMRYDNLPTVFCGVGWALVMALAIKTNLYSNYGGFISAIIISAMLGIVAFAVTLYKGYCKDMIEDYEERISYERRLRDLYWKGFNNLENEEIGV